MDGVLFGVEILWPVLLLQSRMLRVALGYFDSSKIQQAIAFALEAVIEEALKETLESKRPRLSNIGCESTRHTIPEAKLTAAEHNLVCGQERSYEKLVGMLASFDPMYDFNYFQWTHQDETIIDLAHRDFIRRNLVSPEAYDALEHTEWSP